MISWQSINYQIDRQGVKLDQTLESFDLCLQRGMDPLVFLLDFTYF